MDLNRRKFLQFISLAGLGLSLPAVKGCSPAEKKNIKVRISGANSKRGHELWKTTSTFTKKIKLEKEFVIIGGGVSGLSAAYHLNKTGKKDLALFELADEAGGNSLSGENEFSKYPYGAHYLTLPNANNKPLMDFLSEHGIISGYDKDGKPMYRETDLCLDPEERLFIRGVFQDGLIPTYGITEKEREQINSFLKLMEKYKQMKGADGKFFFEIPYANASTDTSLDELDKITFKEFLTKEGFTDTYISWYLDYCCRDDFGAGTHKISAWAGVNYFASHKPNPSNTDTSRVLTWPEGNGKLIELLQKNLKENIFTSCLVKEVRLDGDKVLVTVADFKNSQIIEVICSSCVIATPPFVTNYILYKELPYPRADLKKIAHVPWMTATVTLTKIPEGNGQSLCWDNVGYQTTSLGYIYDQHQDLSMQEEKKVITLYIPLDKSDASNERKLASQRTEDDWKKLVLDELEIIHFGITPHIEEIEIWIWGHAMALPSPGLIKGNTLKELGKPIENKIFFAHTDLSGYSIFEEGFEWGRKAALDMTIKNKA